MCQGQGWRGWGTTTPGQGQGPGWKPCSARRGFQRVPALGTAYSPERSPATALRAAAQSLRWVWGAGNPGSWRGCGTGGQGGGSRQEGRPTVPPPPRLSRPVLLCTPPPTLWRVSTYPPRFQAGAGAALRRSPRVPSVTT